MNICDFCKKEEKLKTYTVNSSRIRTVHICLSCIENVEHPNSLKNDVIEMDDII